MTIDALTEAEARTRHITRSNVVACKLALIACETTGPHLKERCLISPPHLPPHAVAPSFAVTAE